MKPSLRAVRIRIVCPILVVTVILIAAGLSGCGGNDVRPAVNAQQTPPVGQSVARPGPPPVGKPGGVLVCLRPATEASPSPAHGSAAETTAPSQDAASSAMPGSAADGTVEPIWPPPGSGDMKCDGELPPLPEPEVWMRPRRSMTAGQQRRQEEVDQYVARQYCEQGYRIMATTQSDSSSQIFDWMDAATVPGSQATPPPPGFAEPPPPIPASPTDPFMNPSIWTAPSAAPAWQPAPPAVVGPRMVRCDIPMRVPASFPMVRWYRPSFGDYIFHNTTASSLQQYLQAPTKEVVSKPPIAPDTTGCSSMEITPMNTGGPAASNCDRAGGTAGHGPPPGWILCLAATGKYTDASTKYLRECLRRINGASAVACDPGPVAECLSRMREAAPPSQAAADVCRLVKERRCSVHERFDVAACADALKPFGSYGLGELSACITTIREPDCQKAYRLCLYRVSLY